MFGRSQSANQPEPMDLGEWVDCDNTIPPFEPLPGSVEPVPGDLPAPARDFPIAHMLNQLEWERQRFRAEDHRCGEPFHEEIVSREYGAVNQYSAYEIVTIRRYYRRKR